MLLVHEQQGSLEWYLSSRHSVVSGGCKRKIYENTDSVCKMSECWKMTYQKSFTFRCNSGTQISAATWQTVHEHIVAELISATCSRTANITKVMPFKSPFSCLCWLQEKEKWEHRQCSWLLWLLLCANIKCCWKLRTLDMSSYLSAFSSVSVFM